ncbi:hypothetical protein D3C80_1986990 [compost metagenome]
MGKGCLHDLAKFLTQLAGCHHPLSLFGLQVQQLARQGLRELVGAVQTLLDLQGLGIPFGLQVVSSSLLQHLGGTGSDGVCVATTLLK